MSCRVALLAMARGQIVAVLGFGAAAWKTSPRARFIGGRQSSVKRTSRSS
jgi:hypothetical protein